MNRSFRSTLVPWSLALAVLALCVIHGAPALAQIQRVDEDVIPTYILNGIGPWGGAQEQAVAQANGAVIYSHHDTGIGVAQSADPQFLDKVMQSGAFSGAAQDMRVVWEKRVAPPEVAAPTATASVTPGDETYINAMWNLKAIDAFGAWALGFDGTGVRVAVLDGGMCINHVDLAANLDLGASRSFVPGVPVEFDRAGFLEACHLAGVVAAVDNGFGTIGVAPKATIIACKILDSGVGTIEELIEAILYAADPVSQGGAGADIILVGPSTRIDKGGGNTGTGQLISAIASAVSYAAAHNVLVVAGVGDGGLDLDHAGSTVVVPAQSGSALGISATAPVGYAVGWPNGATNFSRPTIYTNFGRSAVWVGAPGGDNTLQSDSNCRIPKVPSGVLNFPCYVFDEVVAPGYVTPTLQVDTWNTGTAVAAAHVAGVAALIKQKYPGILVGDLKAQLAATADGSGGADAYLGHGFLNARRAVTEPLASAAPAGAYPAAARPAPTPRLMLAVAPQPVRGAASFAVTLPREGIARLELFDVAGRSVAVVFDGIVPAGRTVLSWDGRGRDGQRLKPGAYLAGVVSGGIKTARTLVVVGE